MTQNLMEFNFNLCIRNLLNIFSNLLNKCELLNFSSEDFDTDLIYHHKYQSTISNISQLLRMKNVNQSCYSGTAMDTEIRKYFTTSPIKFQSKPLKLNVLKTFLFSFPVPRKTYSLVFH